MLAGWGHIPERPCEAEPGGRVCIQAEVTAFVAYTAGHTVVKSRIQEEGQLGGGDEPGWHCMGSEALLRSAPESDQWGPSLMGSNM